MNVIGSLEQFFEDIRLVDTDYFDTHIKEIAKKLNNVYYELNSESEHCYIVGSIGRKTAVKNVSDVDIIFDLPREVFERVNNYNNNKQSTLLQEIRNVLLERFPNTEISADGQVVDVKFKDCIIELVPAFLQYDNTFKYPDTNDGGCWKITKPFQEQETSIYIDEVFNGLFVKLSNLLRCWKDNVGFKFGGLLIDTMVYNFLEENDDCKDYKKDDYPEIIKKLYYFLKNQNEDQNYWLALGSNQQVKNVDKGKFIKKARNAYNKINSCENDKNLEQLYIDLFGTAFSQFCKSNDSEEKLLARKYVYAVNNEEFIEDKYKVDVRYNLDVECIVEQNGWQPTLLQKIKILRPNKKLTFNVVKCDVPKPYEIYWKVRNCGEEAYRRNDIRGTIFKENKVPQKRIEYTQFRGSHYVECYIIKNKVCVARKKINVPIDSCE